MRCHHDAECPGPQQSGLLEIVPLVHGEVVAPDIVRDHTLVIATHLYLIDSN